MQSLFGSVNFVPFVMFSIYFYHYSACLQRPWWPCWAIPAITLLRLKMRRKSQQRKPLSWRYLWMYIVAAISFHDFYNTHSIMTLYHIRPQWRSWRRRATRLSLKWWLNTKLRWWNCEHSQHSTSSWSKCFRQDTACNDLLIYWLMSPMY